jgi:protein-S-isoprenylcysteine O-methyltransferase Ste14
MKLRALVGSGGKIMSRALPFMIAAVAANVAWPAAFALGAGSAGLIAGAALLAAGIPLWLWAVVQVLVLVPRKKLIATGPFAIMLHPIYTAVALLVLPGCGLMLDTWAGLAAGAALYIPSRIYSPEEERNLARRFPEEYPAYRAKVLLPWL